MVTERTSRGQPRFRRLVLFAIVVCIHHLPAHALTPPPPPAAQLQDAGLNTDTASLIAYLTSGIPASAAAKRQHSPGFQLTIYRASLAVLSERRPAEAVPVFEALVKGALPPHIERAIDDYAAALVPHSQLTMALGCRMEFSYHSALAWAKIDLQAAKRELRDRVTALFPQMQDALERRTDASYSFSLFTTMCQQLCAWGDPYGLELLMDLVPLLSPPDHPELVINGLVMITGQTFGPIYGMPAAQWVEEKEEWLRWWRDNMAAFVPHADMTRHIALAQRNIADPKSIRDYLFNTRRIGFAHETFVRPAGFPQVQSDLPEVRWLDAKASQHTRQLRKIMDNPHENFLVRKQAMNWLVRAKGRWALRAIRPYAEGRIAFDPDDQFWKEDMQKHAQAFVDLLTN